MDIQNLKIHLDELKTTEDKIGMILSNRMDYSNSNGGLVSIKEWDNVANDMIVYFKLEK